MAKTDVAVSAEAVAVAAAVTSAVIASAAVETERMYTRGVRRVLNMLYQYEVTSTMTIVEIAEAIDAAALIANTLMTIDRTRNISVCLEAAVRTIMEHATSGDLSTVHPETALLEAESLMVNQH